MKLRVTAPARRDLAAILEWSREQFGAEGRRRYERLLGTALRDITRAEDPLGSKALPEGGPNARLYHLRSSRRSAGSPAVRQPRHFLVYRRAEPDLIIVLRVLHDAMDVPARLLEHE